MVPLAPHKNTIEPKSKNSRCIMMSEMLFIYAPIKIPHMAHKLCNI